MITADAFEFLLEMKPNSVDLIIGDPPYDFTLRQQHLLLQYCLSASKTAVILFSPPNNQFPNTDKYKPEIYYFWIKPTSTKNTSKRPSNFVEVIQVYGKYKWSTGRHWSQYTNVFTDLVDSTKLHPFRKPPSLIERLLLNHSDPGDMILDPFAGSGVIEQVATQLDRK